MPKEKDYYEVLGVPQDADKDTIKKSYHRLAMKWHPDRNKAPDAESRFKEIAKAYAILKDPKKRARYDAHGMEGVAHFSNEDLFRNFDFGDLFGGVGFGGDGNIFERMFGQRSTLSAHGQDLRITVEIPLAVINSGGSQEIKVSHPVKCQECHGYGTNTGTPAAVCKVCSGTGRKVVTRGEKRGKEQIQFQQISVCSGCHGRGNVISKPCKNCSGHGQVEKEETLKITIPEGIEDGSILRVVGHGMPGDKPGVAPGDLHIMVYARPDSRFQRRGADLWRAETIDVVDVILGTKIKVPTLTGDIEVKIPPGTQPDTILRLQGKGLSLYQQPGRGNLNLRIQVRIPEHLSPEQRELYKSLGKLKR